jgi:hypothetical protein
LADFSLLTEALGQDFDPEKPAGRFNPHVAVVVLVGQPDPIAYPSREAAVAEHVGDWLLQPDDTLGEPRTVDGSTGRGAEGWAPVVEWAINAVAEGVVDLMIAAAVGRLLDRLRRARYDTAGEAEDSPRFFISRGTAAAVAADHVASAFHDEGPLEVEAVEEPSSIAGLPVSEVSYAGDQPWVVLLRNAAAERRYYVVVAPDGEIMGSLDTPILEPEGYFLRPGDEHER